MQRFMCKSKIHRAKVTEANINYMGSITIDSTLLKSADMYPYEQVQVVNVTNGNRFTTYIIEGKADSGVICINGAAARLAAAGDIIIIISYGIYSANEIQQFSPKVIFVDNCNNIVERNS